jgi:hypothetical protein
VLKRVFSSVYMVGALPFLMVVESAIRNDLSASLLLFFNIRFLRWSLQVFGDIEPEAHRGSLLDCVLLSEITVTLPNAWPANQQARLFTSTPLSPSGCDKQAIHRFRIINLFLSSLISRNSQVSSISSTPKLSIPAFHPNYIRSSFIQSAEQSSRL